MLEYDNDLTKLDLISTQVKVKQHNIDVLDNIDVSIQVETYDTIQEQLLALKISLETLLKISSDILLKRSIRIQVPSTRYPTS